MKEYVISRPGLDVRKTSTREEWLVLRSQFIGGSDVAGIMGISPWSTPFTIWCEKMGVVVDKDTASMRYGRENEERLLKSVQEITGREVCVSPVTYVVKKMCANLDGITADGKTGIEIKTTSQKKPWEEVPLYYQVQVQHYMAVCGLSEFFLFAEGNGWQKLFRIEQDPALLVEMNNKISDFWGFVEKKTPPYIPSATDKREINYMISAAHAGILDCSMSEQDFDRFCESFVAAKRDAAEAESIAESLRANIFVGIGAELTRGTAKYQAKVTTVTSERLDTAALKADHPEIYEKYLKKSSYLKLTVGGVNA